MEFNLAGVIISIGVFVGVIGGILGIVNELFKNVKKDSVLTTIEQHIKQNDYEKAFDVCQKHHKRYQESFYFSYFFGKCNDKLKHYHQAINYYEKALVQLNSHPKLYFLKADILLALGELQFNIRNMKSAVGYLTLYLQSHPKDIAALYRCAAAFFDLKKFSKSNDLIEHILQIVPEHPKASLLMSKSCYEMNEFRRAITLLKPLIQKNALNEAMTNQAYIILAKSYMQLKSYKEAAEIYRFLLTQRSMLEKILGPYVLALLYDKQNDKALEIYRDYYSAITPANRCEILYQMGVELSVQGDIYNALDCWEDAFRIDEDYKDLKMLMTKYTVFLDYPFLQNYFAQNVNAFKNFVLTAFKCHANDVISEDCDYFIFNDEQNVLALYRKPSPIDSIRLSHLEATIINNRLDLENVRLFSLFGADNCCQTTTFFNKMHLVASDEFIHAFSVGAA